MQKLRWEKPSGVEIETNAEKGTVDKAIELGWRPLQDLPNFGPRAPLHQTLKQEEPTATLDKRGLPWDERINSADKELDEAGNWKYKEGVDITSAAEVELELVTALSEGE